MFNFIPFDKWLKQNPELDDSEECSECDGSGYHECSCGHEHSCAACGGTGKTTDNAKARKIYNAECAKARSVMQAAQRGEGGE